MALQTNDRLPPDQQTQTSRVRPAEDRRRQLMDAALTIFLRKGFADTTIDEVTREAGVAKGTFYLHFQSKQDVVHALQQRYSRQLAERMRDAAARSASWPEKLDAVVVAAFEMIYADIDLHNAIFQQRHVPTGAGHASPGGEHPPLACLRELLQAGVVAGAYAIDDVEASALLLFAALHGFDVAFHSHDPPSRERLMAATMALFRRTVRC